MAGVHVPPRRRGLWAAAGTLGTHTAPWVHQSQEENWGYFFKNCCYLGRKEEKNKTTFHQMI